RERRVLGGVLAALDLRNGAVIEQTGCTVGDFELGDTLAYPGVVRGAGAVGQGALRPLDEPVDVVLGAGPARDAHALVVERPRGDVPATVLFADALAGGDADVVEEDVVDVAPAVE